MAIVVAADAEKCAFVKNKQVNYIHFGLSKFMYLHTTNLKLTFADLHAFKPAVIDVSVADTSAVLVPSTARSATTDSAGFLERATLWARHHVSDG